MTTELLGISGQINEQAVPTVLATYSDLQIFNAQLPEEVFMPTSYVGRAWHVPLGQWERYRRLVIQPTEALSIQEQMFVRRLEVVEGFPRLFKNITHMRVEYLDIALESGLTERMKSFGPKTYDFLRRFADFTLENAQK